MTDEEPCATLCNSGMGCATDQVVHNPRKRDSRATCWSGNTPVDYITTRLEDTHHTRARHLVLLPIKGIGDLQRHLSVMPHPPTATAAEAGNHGPPW